MRPLEIFSQAVCSLTLGWLATALSVSAQIVPDRTLPNNTVVDVNGTFFEITGGTAVGGNLFHSFADFSVPTNGTAFFDNALDIDNIISRVTGGRLSNIDGLIQANGTANLFAINPSGIVFGPNARLEIGGSFFGSTASSINFTDGTEFSATSPQQPLLTINVPIGLQYGTDVAAVQVQGAQLAVQPGATLALAGGDIVLDNATLLAPGGRVELAGLVGSGSIGIQDDGSLSFPDGVLRGDVSLTNASGVDVTAEGEGNITIQAGNIALSQQSSLLAGIAENLGSPDAFAGDILLDATGAVTIDGGSRIENNILENATGVGGNIGITANSLSLTNDSSLDAGTFGFADAGNISVSVNENVTVQNSRIFSDASAGTGNSGVISIVANGLITLTENSEIISDVFNPDAPTAGIAGSINLAGNLGVTIADSTLTSDSNNADPNAEVGNISLVASEGSIDLNNSTLSTTNFGSGLAGFITLNAGDRIIIVNDSQLFSDAFNDRPGEGGIAGLIEIKAPNGLEIYDSIITSESDNTLNDKIVGNIILQASSGSIDLNRTAISTTNFGVGLAGDILIDARDEVAILDSRLTSDGELGLLLVGSELTPTSIGVRGSQLTTQTENEGGQAGILSLVANPNVTIIDSQLSSSALNNQNITLGGSAGAIEIIVPNGIEISDTTIQSDSANNLNADVIGNIILRADKGDVDLNDTTLSTTNFGAGTAGDIEVAAEDVYLKDSFLEANSSGGDGGFIEVNARDFVQIRDRSRITTNAGTQQAPGNGGGITVNSEFLIGIENSDITANAFEGNGGIIQINTEGILGLQFRQELTPFNDITAFSEKNPELSGVVEINSAAVDTAGLVTLAESPVDVTALVGKDLCSQNEGSEFVITGRGGLPPNPGDVLDSEPEVLEWTTREGEAASEPTDTIANRSIRPNSPPPLIEATGWVRDENGTVVLVADAPTVTPSSPALIQPGCHRSIEAKTGVGTGALPLQVLTNE